MEGFGLCSSTLSYAVLRNSIYERYVYFLYSQWNITVDVLRLVLFCLIKLLPKKIAVLFSAIWWGCFSLVLCLIIFTNGGNIVSSFEGRPLVVDEEIFVRIFADILDAKTAGECHVECEEGEC